MSDSTEHLDQITESQVDKEVVANANFAAAAPAMLFGRQQSTSAALTWGYYGGRFNGTSVANDDLTLTPSATNYIVVHRTTLVVSVSTSATNWNDTATYGRAYKVVTGASFVSTWEDHRQGDDGILGGGGGLGPGGGLDQMEFGVRLVSGTSDTLLDEDRGKLVTYSNASAIAVTLPQAGSLVGSPSATGFDSSWAVFLQNRGAGLVTITPTTSTIDGAATLTLTQHEGLTLFSDGTNYYTSRGRITLLPVTFVVACSDEGSDLEVSLPALTFRMPHAMTLTGVRASLTRASSSGTIQVDINESGASVLSTKLTIDAGEKTSTTAATPAVISDSSIADDAEMTIDIDAVGSGSVPGAGLKVALIGYRTL